MRSYETQLTESTDHVPLRDADGRRILAWFQQHPGLMRPTWDPDRVIVGLDGYPNRTAVKCQFILDAATVARIVEATGIARHLIDLLIYDLDARRLVRASRKSDGTIVVELAGTAAAADQARNNQTGRTNRVVVTPRTIRRRVST